MDRFLNKEVCVRVNRQQAMEFLEICEDYGLEWQSGHSPTAFVENLFFGTAERISIGITGNGGTLMYNHNDPILCGLPAIDYESLSMLGAGISNPVPLDLSKIYD